jgi:hypothetical protein
VKLVLLSRVFFFLCMHIWMLEWVAVCGVRKVEMDNDAKAHTNQRGSW